MTDKRSKNTCKRQKKKYSKEPYGHINQKFHGDNILNWGNRTISTEDLFNAFEKDFHAAYACLIFHGLMLHIDGICYVFHECNDMKSRSGFFVERLGDVISMTPRHSFRSFLHALDLALNNFKSMERIFLP